MMEAAHFRSIERFSIGAIRCRREREQIVCRLFGWPRLPALVFRDAAATATPDRVEQVWTISPGLMARRHRSPAAGSGTVTDVVTGDAYGTMTIGLERVEVDGQTRVHAYERVEGFPSRFLRPPDGLAQTGTPGASGALGGPVWTRVGHWLQRRPLRAWLWTQVGALYSAYHARSAFSCLRQMATLLGGVSFQTVWLNRPPDGWADATLRGAHRSDRPAASPLRLGAADVTGVAASPPDSSRRSDARPPVPERVPSEQE
jgi:hypothetical protein